MIPPVLDLGHVLGLDLPPLPADLQGAVISLPFPALCPFCLTKPAGLLEGHCGKPDCQTAYLNADRAMERLADQ